MIVFSIRAFVLQIAQSLAIRSFQSFRCGESLSGILSEIRLLIVPYEVRTKAFTLNVCRKEVLCTRTTSGREPHKKNYPKLTENLLKFIDKPIDYRPFLKSTQNISNPRTHTHTLIQHCSGEIEKERELVNPNFT